MTAQPETPHFLCTRRGNALAWLCTVLLTAWTVALCCDVPYLNGVLR